MACTLLATPSVGVSDWTNFITQVEYQRRGFMAVTYTNFSASTESAIAAGSIIEVAGSTYQFTETAIDYTGGGSASSDLYIYVKPDAVISTATVVAWGSAPVWVDAKQGFYASAASTTRAVGGMYVGTTASYYRKFLYQGNHLQDCLERNATKPIWRLTYAIGEWDMDSTQSVTLGITGLSLANIRKAEAIIDNDLGTLWYQCPWTSIAGTAAGISVNRTVGGIALNRIAGGLFDSTDFNGTASTVANRGYLIVEYEA